MKTLKLTAILIIHFQLLINNCYAQSPVNSVGSGCTLDFNGGSDYVDCGNIIDLGSTNLVATISFWSKGTGWAINTERSFFSGTSGDGAILVNTNGTVSYYSDYTTNPPFSMTVTTTSTVDISTWNHIALVIDGPNDTYTFYLNGIKEVKTRAFTMVNAYPFKNIEIGRKRNYVWGTFYYKGSMDEVRIWNYARTQTEIQRDMCRKLTGNEPGLVGYWRFDDCGGLTATDASGNGNNGTLY